MNLKFLLMADYASYSADQKLSVNGIFENIVGRDFPITHPILYVVSQLSASPAEYGRTCKLEITLLDEDAQNILLLGGQVVVPTPSGRRMGVTVNNIFALQNVVFPKPGRYQFSLLIDGDEKGELAFEVMMAEPMN